MIPTLGRVVHYTLSEQDAAAINQRRDDARAYAGRNPRGTSGRDGATGHMAHVGNTVAAGMVFPAEIVRVWGDTRESAVNLQVKLDGSDTYWVTSASVGEGPRHYAWPARV